MGEKPYCEPPQSGGVGGLLEQAGNRRTASLNIISRSVRERWGVRDEWKESIPKMLNAIIGDPEASLKDRLKASEILRAMEADNVGSAVDYVRTSIEAEKHDRLLRGEATEITEHRKIALEFDRAG